MKLSTKYLLNIIASVFFFPIAFLGVNFVYYMTLTYIIGNQSETHYEPGQLEKQWTNDIGNLKGKSNEEIISSFEKMKQYKDSHVIWLNNAGNVLFSTSPRFAEGKTNLTVSDAIQTLNQDDEEYLLLYQYLNGKEDSGYAILETPHSLIGTQWEVMRTKYSYLWFIAMLAVCSLFVFNSWMFFKKLHKRLIELQKHMTKQDENGMPKPLVIKQFDELGQVEHSFNQMVDKLRISRRKEQDEAEIRKNLIAGLSHDLRTPLTIIRGHTFSLRDENISEKGKHSLQMINDKISFIGDLIDNLSSFTLLAASKLPIFKERSDILKILRSSLSAWYPIFEKKHFVIDIDLKEPIVWEVDETWLKRILDNIFQNIIRHADSGKFVSVQTKQMDGRQVLLIKDKGPGIDTESENKGAGIGLSIIGMMLKQMDLESEVKSSSAGTLFMIYKAEKSGKSL
ncbi:HAMP domain-containing sensor histidine kinase [Bacillus haynesii]|uniref:HAMP domain-containing sensor histidine kinase n=1 Tax=Bacillus haynesii TaxID=1925021 RepID=UPI002DB95E6D|nr:HAMP domain-containing sensor histidine kinase [Bacillus haynesii]MEC1472297.1 HAMP domain-containing sensor histidine kinase [Bacillus haynesii]MEC1476955.1 HAMP domain-containing sensor histidine kinase [Bacillus haynesii]MEC1484681.1 HAMP domain-containing sensor histidine kinase [Bacillus haynesii]